jgi:hypothetical protein
MTNMQTFAGWIWKKIQAVVFLLAGERLGMVKLLLFPGTLPF